MERTIMCGGLIKQIHDTMEKNANNSLRSQDLTMSQLSALLELSYTPDGELPLKELERRLHVAQSTAAGIISRLEQKGFVEGFGSAEDRRIKMVRLTDSGRICSEAARENMEGADAMLLSALTETERMIFISLLEKVCGSL